ncbi:MAG: hypothetical protein RSD49_01625 [Hafnia sp.]
MKERIEKKLSKALDRFNRQIEAMPLKQPPKKQDETEYLLGSPANARRLRQSIAQLKATDKK